VYLIKWLVSHTHPHTHLKYGQVTNTTVFKVAQGSFWWAMAFLRQEPCLWLTTSVGCHLKRAGRLEITSRPEMGISMAIYTWWQPQVEGGQTLIFFSQRRRRRLWLGRLKWPLGGGSFGRNWVYWCKLPPKHYETITYSDTHPHLPSAPGLQNEAQLGAHLCAIKTRHLIRAASCPSQRPTPAAITPQRSSLTLPRAHTELCVCTA